MVCGPGEVTHFAQLEFGPALPSSASDNFCLQYWTELTSVAASANATTGATSILSPALKANIAMVNYFNSAVVTTTVK